MAGHFTFAYRRIWLIIRCQNDGLTNRGWWPFKLVAACVDSFRLQRQFIALSELQRLLKSFVVTETMNPSQWRFGIDDMPPADKDA